VLRWLERSTSEHADYVDRSHVAPICSELANDRPTTARVLSLYDAE